LRRPNSAPRTASNGVRPTRPSDNPRPTKPATETQPKPATAAQPKSAPKGGKPRALPGLPKLSFGAKPKPVRSKPAATQPASAPSQRAARPAGGSLRAEQQRLKNLARADRKTSRERNRSQRLEISRFTGGSRTKRIAVISAVSAIGALVAVVLATMFTPLMAIKDIQIMGTHRLKSATIKSAVASLMDTPLTMVNENDIAKRLSTFSLIQSFTTLSLPPHTLQINIVERQPFAIVQTTAGYYLYDPAGVLIGETRATWKYPTVVVSGDPRHSTNYRAAIDVLLALPAELYPKVQRIQATSKDDVRLSLRGAANQQILWGDSSASLLKSKVLAALMTNTKKSVSVTYDVSSPNAPTVRYGRW